MLKNIFSKVGGSEKDKKGLGVQVAYRRRVQINLQTENLFMFDAEMEKPKYFRKFYRWLLIDFDLWILWILILKNLLVLTLRMD